MRPQTDTDASYAASGMLTAVGARGSMQAVSLTLQRVAAFSRWQKEERKSCTVGT